jgi:hypothetical protein
VQRGYVKVSEEGGEGGAFSRAQAAKSAAAIFRNSAHMTPDAALDAATACTATTNDIPPAVPAANN